MSGTDPNGDMVAMIIVVMINGIGVNLSTRSAASRAERARQLGTISQNKSPQRRTFMVSSKDYML
jgi:hypothetical protein